MTKALVTGGQGFIGNHLVAKLIELGIEVVVIDKAAQKTTFHDNKKATIIEADLQSRDVLEQCLYGVDLCFHLAAIASIQSCSRDWIFSHQNNVLAFNTLLDVLKKHPQKIKLVYASSSAVYGDSLTPPLSENSPITPASNYGVDKLVNELYAQNAARHFGVSSVGLRFFNVFGPGQQENNSYSGVITLFKKAIASELPLNIYGDGTQTRDFIYIDDVIDGMLKAARTAPNFSGVFNICRGQSVSIEHLAHLMLDLYGASNLITHLDAREGDIRHSQGNPDRAQKHLGFSAKTSMEEGLSQMMTPPNNAMPHQ